MKCLTCGTVKRYLAREGYQGEEQLESQSEVQGGEETSGANGG